VDAALVVEPQAEPVGGAPGVGREVHGAPHGGPVAAQIEGQAQLGARATVEDQQLETLRAAAKRGLGRVNQGGGRCERAEGLGG
jgi:hypothetical protein